MVIIGIISCFIKLAVCTFPTIIIYEEMRTSTLNTSFYGYRSTTSRSECVKVTGYRLPTYIFICFKCFCSVAFKHTRLQIVSDNQIIILITKRNGHVRNGKVVFFQ